jgi:tetrahydromethanopterin S-methyltransferase subunit B
LGDYRPIGAVIGALFYGIVIGEVSAQLRFVVIFVRFLFESFETDFGCL